MSSKFLEFLGYGQYRRLGLYHCKLPVSTVKVEPSNERVGAGGASAGAVASVSVHGVSAVEKIIGNTSKKPWT